MKTESTIVKHRKDVAQNKITKAKRASPAELSYKIKRSADAKRTRMYIEQRLSNIHSCQMMQVVKFENQSSEVEKKAI